MGTANKEVFSKNLQYYMRKKGKSRNDICADLNLRYTTVTDWVKGKTYPRIDKIELLASYFGINKSDLIEDKQNKPEEDLDNLLDGVMLFGGKPLSDTDKTAIRGIISGYMNSKGE